MRVAGPLPASWVAPQAVRDLLPHERGVVAERRLRRIEEGGAGAPHHRRRHRARFVVAHDLGVLREVFEAEDHHERSFQVGVPLRGAIARGLLETEVQGKEGCDQVVAERGGTLAPGEGQVGLRQELEEGLLRVEARGHEMPRPKELAVRGLHSRHPAALHQDALRGGAKPHLSAGFLDCAHQGSAEGGRSSTAHLRLALGGQKHRDVMAEPGQAQIDLAEAVEEEQARPDHRVLELPLHERERGEGARLEEQATFGAALEEGSAAVRGKGRRTGLGQEDPLHDGQEVFAPAAHGVRVLRAEAADRSRRSLEVGPPLEGVSALQDEGHVQCGLDVGRLVTLQLEVRIPGSLPDGPVEEGMGVVEEARELRIFHGSEATARRVAPLEADHLEPGTREVRLQDQGVVTGAEQDPVVFLAHRPGRSRSERRSPPRRMRQGWPSRAHST